MTRLELFLLGIFNNNFIRRQWLIQLFSEPVENFVGVQPGDLQYQDGVWYGIDKDSYPVELSDPIEGAQFTPSEEIVINTGDLENSKGEIHTTYGRAIVNACVVTYAYGNKIPYINEEITGGLLNKIIPELLTKGKITVEEYKKMMAGISHLTVFSSLSVVAATPKTLTVSKDVLKLRDQLLEKHKDELDNPVVAASIEKQLVDADIADMSDDDSRNFLLKSKQFTTVRKKTHIFGGASEDITNPNRVVFMKNSLMEGFQPDDMPGMINDLRTGSFSRASETAYGGAAAKLLSRAYQNVRISEEDCGTKVGVDFTNPASDYREFIGRYLVGDKEALTEEHLASLKGKQVIIRSPQTCKTVGGNYCKRCIGDRLSTAKIKLGPMAATVGGIFMSEKLAKFHATALATVKYDPSVTII